MPRIIRTRTRNTTDCAAMSECVDTGEPQMASHTAVGRRTATAERLRMPRPAQRQTPLVTVYIICVYSNLYAVVRRRPHT